MRGGRVLDSLDARAPVLVYLNHASWWDPMLAVFLGERLLAARVHHGVFEAAQLERYRFFKKLGAIGVEKESGAGARALLRQGGGILSDPRSVLWITPQGRFADVRERPVKLERGVSMLCRAYAGSGESPGHPLQVVPLAMEYFHGEERLPEVAVQWGERVVLPSSADGSVDWNGLHGRLEGALESAQDALARAVVARDFGGFEALLAGRGGVFAPYDWWRSLRSRVAGTPCELNHRGNL
jgi:hypothetical protein